MARLSQTPTASAESSVSAAPSTPVPQGYEHTYENQKYIFTRYAGESKPYTNETGQAFSLASGSYIPSGSDNVSNRLLLRDDGAFDTWRSTFVPPEILDLELMSNIISQTYKDVWMLAGERNRPAIDLKTGIIPRPEKKKVGDLLVSRIITKYAYKVLPYEPDPKNNDSSMIDRLREQDENCIGRSIVLAIGLARFGIPSQLLYYPFTYVDTADGKVKQSAHLMPVVSSRVNFQERSHAVDFGESDRLDVYLKKQAEKGRLIDTTGFSYDSIFADGSYPVFLWGDKEWVFGRDYDKKPISRRNLLGIKDINAI